MTKKDDESIEALFRKANALWFQGDPVAAMEVYAEALAPDAPIASRVKIESAYCLCLCEVGQVGDALERYPLLHRLCDENGLDATSVLRQWAKALEQNGDFRAARKTYQRVAPDTDTQSIEVLKWHHAFGLLNWRDGRLTEACEHLRAATELFPKDTKAGSEVLAVLGNDALLSLELGDVARAFRLAERMQEIHSAIGEVPLSSEVNAVRVRAALAKRQGDVARQSEILQDGLARLEARVPDDWMRRLDLANDYVAAALETAPSGNAAAYLETLVDAAPGEVAWIGRFMLARLQIRGGDLDKAKTNLADVLASFIGTGTPQSEVEIVMELAALAARTNGESASIVLSKLALKHLAEIAQAFDGNALQQVVAAGAQTAEMTVDHLEAAGRFEEAQVLKTLSERITRRALVLRLATSEVPGVDLVPFDLAERAAVTEWEQARHDIRALREAGELIAARDLSVKTIDTLLGFTETMTPVQVRVIAPLRGNLRLNVVPSAEKCVVHYHWANRAMSSEIEVTSKEFTKTVADLRNAVTDRDAWEEPAARLYDHLIGPIENELADVACLEIDTSSLARRIPFAMLSDGARCLVQKVRIKYVLPPAPAAQTGEARSGLAHFSAFGSGPLAVRPKALMSESVTTGFAFTRQRLLDELAARPEYLSVATHLDSEPTRPDLWALMLGSEDPLYLSDFGGENFDLNGVRIALFATCASGLEETRDRSGTSLAALALDKGVKSYIGTLWDISEAAAARFVDMFWDEFLQNPNQDPATLLSILQSRDAERAHQSGAMRSRSGGIGDRSTSVTPADWAAFAIFENSNAAQRSEKADG